MRAPRPEPPFGLPGLMRSAQNSCRPGRHPRSAYRRRRRGLPHWVEQHERRHNDATQRRQRRAHRDPVPRRCQDRQHHEQHRLDAVADLTPRNLLWSVISMRRPVLSRGPR